MLCTDCHGEVSGHPERCPFCAAVLAGQVRLVNPGPNKIAVIKALRELTGMGLKEAKDFVESAPAVLRGNPATILRALRDAGAAAETLEAPVEADPPPTRRSVLLRDTGPNKIAVIKVVREATGLGLKETKDLVESAPQTLSCADPERVCAELRAAGAQADLH